MLSKVCNAIKLNLFLLQVKLDMPLPLSSENVPKVFSSLPEWIVEDIADFLLFAMQ